MSAAGTSARFPVLLDVNGRLVVVLGATRAAERLAVSFARHGADVVIIAADVTPTALSMEADGLLTIEPRGYVRGDLKGAFVVVCDSGSAEIDDAATEEARQGGSLVVIPADGDASDLIVPSVVRRGPLQIAISTEGVAPEVAHRVRREVADAYGSEWGVFVALMGAVRRRAIEELGLVDSQLGPLFEAIAGSDVLQRIRSGEDPTADEVLERFAHSIPVSPDTPKETS